MEGRLASSTCRECLEEALAAAGFFVRMLPPGPGLLVEARSDPGSNPRFLVEVLPPGVLPGEAFYREAQGFRIRYRQAPGVVLSGDEMERLLRALDSLPERLRPGMPLGVDLPEHSEERRETGTDRWIEIGGGAAGNCSCGWSSGATSAAPSASSGWDRGAWTRRTCRTCFGRSSGPIPTR